MMSELAYLKTAPKQTALLKAECADFIVRERLGYELSGEGEFVAVQVRKTDCNTLFVGEKLAQFAGVSPRNMSYAGLKDRRAVTEQWFCLHMPGQQTPDFDRFQLNGVEILAVIRHHRKIRIGSLDGNEFNILLRNVTADDDLSARLERIRQYGFPNYFTEQRFGRDGDNLTQALRWARGEISVKERHKRSFYLSAARSEIFNLVVSDRIKRGLAQQVLPYDILQLKGSHSWFVADGQQDLTLLQQRLGTQDILLTAPLIGETVQPACEWENRLIAQQTELLALMRRERVKPARRPSFVRAEAFRRQFEENGLRLMFYLPAGSYATALIRELVLTEEPN